MKTVTQSAARIERTIHRYSSLTVIANFKALLPLLEGREWSACLVDINRHTNTQRILVHGYVDLDTEHAAALIIALQMAIDWIAEETAAPIMPERVL